MSFGRLIRTIVWTFAILGAIQLVKSDDEFLRKLTFECSRECDTHFSGANCWEKTFTYFINHLLQSFVDFGNAEVITKHPDATDLLYSTYSDYIQDPDIADFINNLVNEFELIFNRTLTKIPGLTTNIELNKKIKCPIACNKSSYVVWISLFSVFIGLTLAAIGFVAIYIAYIKAKHKKFEKESKIR